MFQPPISPKQAAILNELLRFLLVTGPRLASKTIGCEHAIPWHLWNTPGAVGMMLGKTISQNSDAGTWAHLVNNVIPTWIEGRMVNGERKPFGFEWETEPRMEATTHKLYFEIRNKFYDEDPSIGISRMYLDSLDNEADAEDKFKGKQYSLIYWTELSNFKLRRTFDVLQECLRSDVWKPEQQRMICDTNPAEEGPDSWIYKLWYWFRTLDLSNIRTAEDIQNLDEETRDGLNLNEVVDEEVPELILGLQELQNQLAVHEFTIDDNIFLSPAQKRAQRAKYSHDSDLLARFYFGKWVKAAGVGIFKEVWRPAIHVLGELPTPLEPEPDLLLPDEKCNSMLGGWDIGPRNVSVHLIDKVLRDFPSKDRDGNRIDVPKPTFSVLDEYHRLGEPQKISDVVRRVLDKVHYWEDILQKPVLWIHWSDRSSFEKYDNIADSYEHLEVFQESNGEIELRAVIKGAGSVERRIDIVQRLLFEERIWVGRVKCPALIDMFSAMKRNKANKLGQTNIFKHAFDSFSYPVSHECWTEMTRAAPRNRTANESARVLMTPL